MQTTHRYAQTALLLLFAGLFAYILWPFLPSLIFAALFATLLFPFARLVQKRARCSNTSAAILTVIATIVFILTPFFVFIALVSKQAFDFVREFDANALSEAIQTYGTFSLAGYDVDVTQYKDQAIDLIRNSGSLVYDVARDISGQAARAVFLFIVFILFLFYFLKDGEEIIKHLSKLLPFSDGHKHQLLHQLKQTGRIIAEGTLATGLMSGIAVGIGFALFGVKGALIWGILGGIFSLIPTLGTLFVYVLGALLAAVLMGPGWAVGLLIYCVIIDIIVLQNVVKPILLDNRFSLHPILVFFALVGGVNVFGSLGLIYGPAIAVIFLTLLNVSTGAKRAS